MARPARGFIRVEGLEHIQQMLKDGTLITPTWAKLMSSGTEHMLGVAKSRAPVGTGRLAGGFTTQLHGNVTPFWGAIRNPVTGAGAKRTFFGISMGRGSPVPYPLYLDRGSRKGTAYRMGGRGKRTKGWLSNVVRIASVKARIAGLVEEVRRAVEGKWRN